MSPSIDHCTSCRPLACSLPMPSFMGMGRARTKHNLQPCLQPTATRCLKRGQLHVEANVGAGLELFPCDKGFLVQDLDNTPGQPDLRLGDIIVAIGATLLCGLAPHEVEERFGAGFHDGASILIGSDASIAELTLEEVKRAAQSLFDPATTALQFTRDSPAAPGETIRLPENGILPTEKSHTSKLTSLQSHFHYLQSRLREVAQKLQKSKVDAIDAKLTSRQRVFIVWLASRNRGQCPDLGTSDGSLASSATLQEWLQALDLAAHRSAFATWCVEQGAISLSELVEYREDLAAAMTGILSPMERSRLLSHAATEAAELATLHGRAQELASLLDTVLTEMGESLTRLDSIGFDILSCEDNTWLPELQPAGNAGVRKEKPATGERLHHHGPSLLRDRSSVMTTNAHHISKRDQELLRLVADCC